MCRLVCAYVCERVTSTYVYVHVFISMCLLIQVFPSVRDAPVVPIALSTIPIRVQTTQDGSPNSQASVEVSQLPNIKCTLINCTWTYTVHLRYLPTVVMESPPR